jgi:hypothetical protein
VVLAVTMPLLVVLYRRSAFAAEHGEGVPHITDEGETALNNHGGITLVSKDVYDEAVLLQWMVLVLLVLTMATVAVLCLTAFRGRWPPGGRPDTGEEPPEPEGVWRFVALVVKIAAYGALPATFVLLAFPFAHAASSLRFLVRSLFKLAPFCFLAPLPSVWWHRQLERRIREDPDCRHRNVAYDELCRRHGVDDAIVACRMEAAKWKKTAYIGLAIWVVSGIVYFLCY